MRREDGSIQDGDPSGSGGLVVDTERTPQELAALYLDAMGESGYDVSALPNDSRPAVEHDFDNPAEALADLCDSLGCRVVLRLDNTVAIVQVGVGADLPASLLLEDSATPNPPEMPDNIAVVCGPSVYQVDFPLEAVGLDVATLAGGESNETIQPIDELSYTPVGGWSVADLPYLLNVGTAAGEADVTGLRSLATKSVFRYYRIMMPVNVPGYDDAADGLVTKLEQILPLIEEQAATGLENHNLVPLAATVFGVWYPAPGRTGQFGRRADRTGRLPAGGRSGRYVQVGVLHARVYHRRGPRTGHLRRAGVSQRHA